MRLAVLASLILSTIVNSIATPVDSDDQVVLSELVRLPYMMQGLFSEVALYIENIDGVIQDSLDEDEELIQYSVEDGRDFVEQHGQICEKIIYCNHCLSLRGVCSRDVVPSCF